MPRPLRPAVAGLAALLMSATSAVAEPPLWAARDADSTVYLFGTVHLLPGDKEWRSETFDRAFAAADELWLEIDLLSDKSAGFGKLAMLGASPDRPLSARLAPDDHARLSAAAESLGLSMAALDPLRPWLASVMLSVEAARKAGLAGDGADLLLAREARERGLPVRAFETADQQLRFFADLDEEAEHQLLLQTLEDLDEGPALYEDMLEVWSEGDVPGLEMKVLDTLKDAGAEVFDALLVRRNIAWADEIERMLQGSGTQFVAVGAGHLLGPQSVQAVLAERGIAVERIEGDR